jgi:hypothetical protein
VVEENCGRERDPRSHAEAPKGRLGTASRRWTRHSRSRALPGSIGDCGVPSVLSFGDIQQRDGRWAIVDLKGKHGRIRTVPMPGWAHVAVETWRQSLARGEGKSGLGEAPEGGRIARAVNKAGNVASQTLTPRAIFQMVRDNGKRLGVSLGPHDPRNLREARPQGECGPRADSALARACFPRHDGEVSRGPAESERCAL